MDRAARGEQGEDEASAPLLPLRPAEVKLLVLIRKMGYGVLHELHVAEGQPVLIEKQCEKIRLT